jgi:hypothetical protein
MCLDWKTLCLFVVVFCFFIFCKIIMQNFWTYVSNFNYQKKSSKLQVKNHLWDCFLQISNFDVKRSWQSWHRFLVHCAGALTTMSPLKHRFAVYGVICSFSIWQQLFNLTINVNVLTHFCNYLYLLNGPFD